MIAAVVLITAICCYTMGRSISRIRLARAIRRMADKYRREAFELSDQLPNALHPAAAERLRERADNLLGKAEALCDLVDQV